MKYFTIFLINIYQTLLSSDTGMVGKHLFRGKTCGFYPTCSEYTKQALKKYGFLKGTRLGIHRILKCTPSHEGEVDLVP